MHTVPLPATGDGVAVSSRDRRQRVLLRATAGTHLLLMTHLEIQPQCCALALLRVHSRSAMGLPHPRSMSLLAGLLVDQYPAPSHWQLPLCLPLATAIVLYAYL